MRSSFLVSVAIAALMTVVHAQGNNIPHINPGSPTVADADITPLAATCAGPQLQA